MEVIKVYTKPSRVNSSIEVGITFQVSEYKNSFLYESDKTEWRRVLVHDQPKVHDDERTALLTKCRDTWDVMLMFSQRTEHLRESFEPVSDHLLTYIDKTDVFIFHGYVEDNVVVRAVLEEVSKKDNFEETYFLSLLKTLDLMWD